MKRLLMNFNYERNVFKTLKDHINKNLKSEFEKYFNSLVADYNTSIYENRFIVGGAIEVFTYALLKQVGIQCNLYGDETNKGDIILPKNKMLSIKATCTGGIKDVKLSNKMGDNDSPLWETATLFINSEFGIIYADPLMIKREYLEDTGDGLKLKSKGLKEDFIIKMNLNRKQPTTMSGFSHKASVAVARKIINDTNSNSLKKSFYFNGTHSV